MEDQELNIIQLVFGVALFAILFTTFIIFMTVFFRKNQLLFYKEITELKLVHENNLLKSELEMQEQTFQNISREIHDSLCLDLSVTKLYLNTLDLSDAISVEEKIKNSIQLLGKVIQKMRDISKSLNSELIKESGLFPALEHEIKIITGTGSVSIDYKIEGEPIRLHPDKALLVFRIIQESLNNVIKHSGATSASIKFIFDSTKLEIDIQDNGVGFNTNILDKSKDAGSSGFRNIRQRTKILEGKCEILSSPGNGTKVIVNIPILNPNIINHEHDHNYESSSSR